MSNDSVQSVIVIPEGKICDYIDGKLRNDTPEEYVRQTIEKRLVNEHKYPKDQIKIEYTLHVGSKKPRADIVIFPKNCSSKSQDKVYIIIECKKENISPNGKKNGVGQLKAYMSSCLNCEWGMWTNGKHKDVFRKMRTEKGNIEFMEYNDIPSADGSLDDIDRPKRNSLKKAVEDNLLFVFRTCHNYIYVNEGLQKQPAFFEFLKVIFCKIEDERNIPNDLGFFTTSAERSNPDGQLTVQKRISKIFDRVKKKEKYRKIFTPNDKIELKPRTLAYIVAELQKYDLLHTNIDIKGKAYEELVGANLRGDRGEFFTPRNVAHMTVEMINPKGDEKVLDPACGTGGFLVIAMNKIIEGLEQKMEESFAKRKVAWSQDEMLLFQQKVTEIATSDFFGFDLNPDLVKATKMNMVMNNDGSGNIFQNNSLLPPHEWEEDFKKNLAAILGIDKSRITNHKSLGFFDVVLTNPPFGSKIPIKDQTIIEQFEIAHIWEKKEGRWIKTDRLQSSVPPEQVFVERCIQLLKPGGRLGIVLPDSILGSPGLGYIRQWLIGNTRIVASIDLHVDTFQPRNGTQTSILIVQKKTPEEIKRERINRLMADYNMFMAMVEHVGHDKRGNPLFKRDKYGNEMLIEETEIVYLGETVEGQKTATMRSKTKIIDDQTQEVARVFKKWKANEGIGW